MGNIKFFENIAGYPVIIPKKTCHAGELRAFLERYEKFSEVITITVRLDDNCDKQIIMVLDELGFIADEKEHIFSCDLTSWSCSHQLPDESEYRFVSFDKCGISPFLDIAQDASKGDIYSFSEYFNTLMEGALFDPSLWEILYYKRNPIGLVIAQMNDGVGQVEYIAVMEQYQNKGVGSFLHIRGMQILKKSGAVKYIVEIDGDKEKLKSIIKLGDFSLEGIRHHYIK